MTEYYKIKKYLIYKLNEDDVVIQNEFGIVKVHESRMINFLSYLDTEVFRQIEKSKIYEFFNKDTDHAIEFLEENNILKRFEIDEFKFDTIFLFTNENKQLYDLENILKEKGINVISDNFHDIEKYNLNNSLVVIFQNPYSKKLSRRLINFVNTFENTLLITSYLYNNVFYIDNIYSLELNNPCHFCNLGFIESKIRSNSEQMSYQDLIDTIYEIDDEFEVYSPLSKINSLKITIYLFDFIFKYINIDKKLYSKDILNCFKFDLNNNSSMMDTAIHWELCDCYE